MKFNRAQYKQTQWYRQGGGAKLFYASYPTLMCLTVTRAGRRLPVFYRGVLIYFYNDFMSLYFPEPSMEWVARFYVNKQLQDSQFLQNLKRTWVKNYCRPFFSLARKIEQTDLRVLSDGELRQEFKKFSYCYNRMWSESIFLDAFDVVGERILAEQLPPGKIFKPEILAWFGDQSPTIMQQEQQSLRALMRSPKFHQALARHVAEYHWLQNDYAKIVRLMPADFLARIKSILKQTSSVKKRVSKKSLVGLSPAAKAVLHLLATVASWRDDRKACNQLGSSIGRQFLKEFSRRFGVKVSQLEQGCWWEIEKIFSNPKAFISLVKKRRHGVMFTLSSGKTFAAQYGQSARNTKHFLDGLIIRGELRGSSAFRGVVKGRVKIILDQRDFRKMRKGDILVAPNTRPEYVPLMKMASAIISEEGGLTCHSAIVSRELKKPCVVGVQGVTHVLRDGDLVEVDAEKGIVRKLS